MEKQAVDEADDEFFTQGDVSNLIDEMKGWDFFHQMWERYLHERVTNIILKESMID